MSVWIRGFSKRMSTTSRGIRWTALRHRLLRTSSGHIQETSSTTNRRGTSSLKKEWGHLLRRSRTTRRGLKPRPSRLRERQSTKSYRRDTGRFLTAYKRELYLWSLPPQEIKYTYRNFTLKDCITCLSRSLCKCQCQRLIRLMSIWTLAWRWTSFKQFLKSTLSQSMIELYRISSLLRSMQVGLARIRRRESR